MKWLRRIAVAAVVAVLCVAMLWYWLLHTESGAGSAWSLAERVTNGQLQGDYTSGALDDAFALHDLSWVSDGTRIDIESVVASFDVDLLPLTVSVSLARVGETKISITSQTSEPTKPVDIGAVVHSLRLPFALLVNDLQTGEIQIRTNEQDPIVIDGIELAAHWHEALDIARLRIRAMQAEVGTSGKVDLSGDVPFNLSASASRLADEMNIVLEGDLDNFTFNVAGVADVPSLGQLALRASGIGDATSLRVDSLDVRGDALDATGNANLHWAQEPAASANVKVTRFDLSSIADGWPATHPLVASLSFSVDDKEVQIDDSLLSVADSNAQVHISGVLQRADMRVDGQLTWSELQWPIDTSEPRVVSESGNMVVAGIPESWTVEGLIMLGTAELADGRFVVTGAGDRDGAIAEINEGRALGGDVAGKLQYNWRDNQPWNVDLMLSSIKTNSLLPEWPASISGQVIASGAQRPFAIDAELVDVNGVLREQPFTAQGSFSHNDVATSADKLRIEHGGLRVDINGSADEPDGLSFDLAVDAIEAYVDTISGGLTANGVVSRSSEHPYLSINLDSDAISIGDTRLSGIRIRDQREENAIAGFSLSLERLETAGQTVLNSEAELRVGQEQQSFQLSGEQEKLNFTLAVAGAFDDWRKPLDSDWRGAINDFVLDLDDEHTLRLEQSAQVVLAKNAVDLDQLCVAAETGARLCLDADKFADDSMALRMAVEALPLNLVERFADTGLRFEQRISGSIDLQRAANGVPSGTASIGLSPGIIQSIEQQDLSITTAEGELGFDVIDGTLLSGKVLIPMPGTGEINGHFAVLDINRGGSSSVAGEFDMSMSDIRLLAHFSPLIDSIEGALKTSLKVGGNLNAPLVTGTAEVVDGEVLYAPLGLHLEDVNLKGMLSDKRSVQLEGEFRAGEGVGRVVSSADYSDVNQPGLRFQVQGENLQLVNVPDLQATIAPAFEVALHNDQLEINGAVRIPYARVSPNNLTESRVSESEDVVVVAGELPGAEAELEPDSALHYSGTLELTLGDDVLVDLDVAEAQLTGATTFSWQGDPVPMADGRIDMDGSIEAFGQVLKISEGAIRFPGGEATNPNLRIRAEREIYGNSQVKRAGVLVDGTAKRPIIEAYTAPMTTEERALTLLVTGSDFDYEQGVGAVDFGTYIAPRLFVSYGVGIFDRDNVISARYDLTSGFGIKASSGSKESGVDLNYRFEN